jgi:predicted nuclease of predicted toxin-antitoxin system
MKIYLDDNQTDRRLVALLVKAGYQVVRPTDVALVGKSDALHLEQAIRDGLVVLTSDAEDFQDLSRLVLTSGGHYPGILVVRFDNDPLRDMKPKHVVAAVSKLDRSGLPLVDQLVVLNQWR